MSFKKTMKMLLIQLVIITVIFGVVYIRDADAQQGMRQFICDLFDCQKFVDLGNLLLSVKQDTETGLANQDILQANQTTVIANQGTADGKLDQIIAEFPITVQPDPATAKTLTRIERKLDYYAKSEQSIWLEPYEGATPQFIEVLIYIRGESLREITAWGLDITFDNAALRYQAVAKGRLTESWALLDANEIQPGTLRVGAVLGAGPPIAGDVIGEIAIISFEVIGGPGITQLCITNMVDHLATYAIAPPCADLELE